MKNKTIPIVIPSYEPSEDLIFLCEDLYKLGLENIIVVDDGSGFLYRNIFNVLEEKGCIILRNAVNLGKGRALKNAFNYILNQEESEMIGCMTADSDGQHSPVDIKRCVDLLCENPTSFILGCRSFDGGEIPFKSRFGNELTKKVFSFLCGMNVSDTQTGLRGISVDFMKSLLTVQGERFEYEMHMLIASKGMPILEVPIETIYDSKEHHKTHFKPIQDSIRIYRIFGEIFIKYVVSSFSACLVDIVLFSVLCNVLMSKTDFFYVSIATILARIISAVYNYFINYTMVFKSDKGHGYSTTRYFTLATVQMLLSAFFVTVIMMRYRVFSEVTAKIIVDTILFFISYYIQRKLIF